LHSTYTDEGKETRNGAHMGHEKAKEATNNLETAKIRVHESHHNFVLRWSAVFLENRPVIVSPEQGLVWSTALHSYRSLPSRDLHLL
jgi:hypothetical protein